MTPPEVAVVFSLGANLGDPSATLREALRDLNDQPGITVQAVSPWYRTAPVGQVDQPDFINLVAVGTTTLEPDQLWHAISAVELAHGRQRVLQGGPRTLDIDVVSLGDQISTTPHLTLPHPRAHQRGFVLVPWLAIDPEAVLPGHGRVGELVKDLDTRDVQPLESNPAVRTQR